MLCIYIYIHIYIYRERESERESVHDFPHRALGSAHSPSIGIHIYHRK